MRRSASILTIFVLLLAGCRQAAKPATQPGTVVDVRLGHKTFHLEIVNNFSTRQKGLMDRHSMPADSGMIFVFAYSQVLSFWMKDTYIPLDIIYIDSSANIVSIKQMQPLVENPPVSSDRAAKWAIELNQGQAAQAGAKVGDHIDIPPEAQDVTEEPK